MTYQNGCFNWKSLTGKTFLKAMLNISLMKKVMNDECQLVLKDWESTFDLILWKTSLSSGFEKLGSYWYLWCSFWHPGIVFNFYLLLILILTLMLKSLYYILLLLYQFYISPYCLTQVAGISWMASCNTQP